MTVTRRDVIIREGPFSRAELDALPDDGRRHELLDGVLLMSPAPGRRHQRIVVALAKLLDSRAPRGAEVMVAPFDVALGERTVIEPDVLVARRSDLTEQDLRRAASVTGHEAWTATTPFEVTVLPADLLDD